MTIDDSQAQDGQQYRFNNNGHEWNIAWHPPDSEPDGTPYGSGAICFTPSTETDGEIIIGSHDGESWEVPAGRPDPGENWRATLDREVFEEACARIEEAELVGFMRGECLAGPDLGLVHVRSLWAALVTLEPWKPQHEIKYRKVVSPKVALELLTFPDAQLPIYRRWLGEARSSKLQMNRPG